MKVAMLLFLLYITSCYAQSFTATMDLSLPNMGSGVITTTFGYDWNQYGFYYTFNNGAYSVLHSYNQFRGEDPNQAIPFIDQRIFTSSSNCCESDNLASSMPRLFWDTNKYVSSGNSATINGQTCYPYKPVATYTTSTVTTIWFSQQAAGATVCRVAWNTGAVYTFSNIKTGAVAAAPLTPPANCGCSKPIDISLVLDRTGSIRFWMWNEMYSFLQGLGKQFTWGPDKANLALVQFNTFAFGEFTNGAYGPVPKISLAQGSSNAAVTSTLSSLKCCNAYNNNPDASCCNGWTSISSGIRAGVDQLALSKRPWATKVLILVTDGKQNTLYDPNNKNNNYGNTCYSGCCQYSLQSNLCPDLHTNPGVKYLYCIGDTNGDGIPDEWVPPSQTNTPVIPCSDCPANQKSLGKCYGDLINAREYGFNKVGNNLIIYSVGVGSVPSYAELSLVANNRYKRPTNINPAVSPITWTPNYKIADNDHPERIINTTLWTALNTILTELTSKVCSENKQACGNCCGVCMCGQCIPPTKCNTDNFCITGTPQTCCTNTNTTCPSTVCTNGYCDPVAQKCASTPVACKPDDTCYSYQCVEPAGCTQKLKGEQPQNLCESSYCDTTTNPPTLVSRKQKVCPALDACNTYACDPATGNCVATPIPIPANPDACTKYFCDPKNFTTPIQTQITTCTAPNLCSASVCNKQTGKCDVTQTVCNDPNNKCDLTTCDMATGNCNTQNIKTCPAPVGDLCQPPGTCNTLTGGCDFPPRKTCVSQNCSDVTCEPATGNCKYLPTGCEAICVNANCSAKNNFCWEYRCDGKGAGTNCDIVTDLSKQFCTLADTDKCKIFNKCENTTGCVYDDVKCDPPAPCKILTRDSTNPNCCVYTDKPCDLGDPCQIYSCDLVTGNCTQTPKCDLTSDACTKRTCEAGVCKVVNSTCPALDPCTPAEKCDPILGCIFKAIDCDDLNNCTIDKCSGGTCSHEKVLCEPTDLCHTAQCNPLTGTCSYPPIDCSSDNNCTKRSCDPLVGCVTEVLNGTLVCDDGNECTVDSCPVDLGHCVYVPFVCPAPNETCVQTKCVTGFGCVPVNEICLLDARGRAYKTNDTSKKTINSTDCSLAFCNQTTGNCSIEVQSCGALVQILGASLGAAALAGIIVAVIIAVLAGAGGGAYAYAQGAGAGPNANIMNNPLYAGQGNQGVNPLFKS